jgi:hypothetical protein
MGSKNARPKWRAFVVITNHARDFSTPQAKIRTDYTDLNTAEKILMLMLQGISIRAIERFTGT